MGNRLVKWLFVLLILCLDVSAGSVFNPLINNNAKHPFYVSVIEIEHNKKDKTAEISIRIFSTDLETTLNKFNNSKLDVSKPENKKQVELALDKYIQQKLSISIENKPATMHLIGFEHQLESIWSYFVIDKVASMKTVQLHCSILYDFQTSQMNIIHVKENGIEKSFQLTNPKTEASFNF
jgi:hypothetical protein